MQKTTENWFWIDCIVLKFINNLLEYKLYEGGDVCLFFFYDLLL